MTTPIGKARGEGNCSGATQGGKEACGCVVKLTNTVVVSRIFTSVARVRTETCSEAGGASGITVIDCDSPEAAAACQDAGIVSSMTQATKRGVHIVFKHNGERDTVRVNGVPGVDRRGEGGYVRAYAEPAQSIDDALSGE